MPLPPVVAFAQFFDDVRVEQSGKAILIGQYVGEMVAPPGAIPVDRLSILMSAKWQRDFEPKTIGVLIQMPGQPAMSQALPFQGNPKDARPPSEFSAVFLQGVIQLRFLPLRIGDTIDVWLVVDGTNIPAGRLHITDQPPSAAVGVLAL